MNKKPQNLPFVKKLAYALGQFGWSLASFGAGSILVYFYLPPDNGTETMFPAYIDQGYIWGLFTLIGLVFAVGRLFDAVTDPMIAGLSDRCKWKFGRRRSYLALSVLPFALFSFLIFYPPADEPCLLNSVWVFSTILIFYWFMTMYVTPFFAWLSELGHTSKERLQLSTMISITWALGAIVGSQVYAFQGIFEKILADGEEITKFIRVDALQLTLAMFAIISFVFMLLPVLFINEEKYCEHHVSKEGSFEAVKNAFKNKNFFWFTMSDLVYWTAVTLISAGMVYYITVLLQLDKEFTSLVTMVMFLLSFVFYVPVNLIAQKTGKKKLCIFGFIIFALVYLYVFFLGWLPFSNEAQGIIIAVITSIPLSIFGILPNAIVADIAEADGLETGNFKAGVFFGARTFMQKIGQMFAGILLPSLILIGKEPGGNDFGVRLVGIAALIFCVLGLLAFLKYREKDVLNILQKNNSVT